ncbi:MAG: hypothetical protein VX228_04780 [Pseudomonadota bacterium]|nr:hypothetical protein [Pseudomonadota bacterium]
MTRTCLLRHRKAAAAAQPGSEAKPREEADNPNLTIAFDTDATQTVDTRLAMFDRAAADNLLVTGSHLDFPGLGKVRKSANGYVYQPAPWQYGA